MKITSIKQQKNNKNKYSIFINNTFAFTIDTIDLLYYKLKEGCILEQYQYENIINNIAFNEAKNTALKYIEYKLRTKEDIINKLKLLNYSDEIINAVINKLIKYDYINDKKYAMLYTKEKFNLKLQGKIKIKYDLKVKGIDEKIIDNVFKELNLNEEEIMLKLLNKKIKNKNNIEIKEKKRIFNFLIRKGFSYENINYTFKKFIKNM